MEQRVVTIFGGTGFLGRYVVKLLAHSGWTVRVVSRHPSGALPLKTAGDVGQIVLMYGNITDEARLPEIIRGSDAVINLVGALYESGKQSFTNLHAHGAEKLAKAARAAGVSRFVQISALGVEKASKSANYARTKVIGEKAVLTAFPSATILRPSVLFGPEDNFFNQFAAMAAFSPFLPNIGGGDTRFQPVYVGDVAWAIQACLNNPETQGRVYELGGPQVFSFAEILEYVLGNIGKKRFLLPIPFSLAPLAGLIGEAVHTLSLGLFKPPITRDQVRLLQYDNVTSQGLPGFAQLGIMPTAADMVVPHYLARFNVHTALAASFEKMT